VNSNFDELVGQYCAHYKN